MANDRTTCLVVGGGPAGLVLALLLSRAGVDVMVLEKHADFLRDFRGDTVHPSTLQLLDELGLGQEFTTLSASRVEEVAFPVDGGRPVVLADFRRLHVAHPYVAMVPQWDLLDLLARSAAEEPSFRLRMNTEVTELVPASGPVTGARFRTKDGTEGIVHADLTVACDGRWSVAHGRPGLVLKEFPTPIDVWWFRLPGTAQDDPSALTPRAGDGRFALVIPRPGYLQIAYVARKGLDGYLRRRGVESFRREVAELMPEMRDRVHAIGSMDDVKHLDVRVNRLRRWHTAGLLCIGDAAHAMSPVGGVGINLAVQDAVAAATLLAQPLRREQVGTADLAKVRRRRLWPTVLVQTMQRLAHRELVLPILDTRRAGPPSVAVSVLRRFPALTGITARVIGVGPRPEHAPPFARRP